MKKLLWIILFLIPFGLYCLVFQIPFSSDKGDWSAFGSYMGGIYGSLAFIVLAYTTWITQKQFKKNNEDNTFFKLHDALQNRIESSSIEINDKIINGHSTPKFLVEDFYKKFVNESRKIARNILCNDPDMIADVSYSKIFQVTKGMKGVSENKTELINNIKKRGDFSSRWEFIKHLIGSQNCEEPKIAEALESAGSVLFYKISFNERKHHYEFVLDEMLVIHGTFLDVYLKNISFLVTYAETCTEKELYYKYIKSQLSKYELVLLFYFVVGSEKIEKAHTLIGQSLLNVDFGTECRILMIDFPDAIQIKSDLHDAFN